MANSLFSAEWQLVQDHAPGVMAPLPQPLSIQGRNGSEDTQSSFDKIRKQLSGSSESVLLQGPLLKRSETLRKWNQRWFTLDPSTGKMEYRTQRGDAVPRGIILFEAHSTITISPLNLHPSKQYEGSCFYIGTPQKKEYFLCAETPGAAKAWVSTLRAVAIVLKAHREAVDSLSGNGQAKTGTVAAAVASANATAREAAKEIDASLQSSIKAFLHRGAPQLPQSPQTPDGGMDDLSIMKETLRIKDEELRQMAKDLRARDHTIKELADRLSETAEAAEAAAAAATTLNQERKAATTALEQIYQDQDESSRSWAFERRASENRLAAALSAADNALQEAQAWRLELGKARERILELEAALVRSEDNFKTLTAKDENELQASRDRETAAVLARDEALQQISSLQAESLRISKLMEPMEGQMSVEKKLPGLIDYQKIADTSTDAPVDIHTHNIVSSGHVNDHLGEGPSEVQVYPVGSSEETSDDPPTDDTNAAA